MKQRHRVPGPGIRHAALATFAVLAVGAATACSGGCAGKANARKRVAPPTAHTPPVPSQPPSNTTAAASETPPSAANAPFDESAARSYFIGQPGDADALGQALALDKWPDAIALADRMLAAQPDLEAAQRARLQLVRAYALEHADQWAEAATAYAQAGGYFPALADYINYHHARCLYFAHQVGALAKARAVRSDSIVGGDALLLIGDILRGGNDTAAVIAHYREVLATRKHPPRKAEARFRLAEALVNQRAQRPLNETEMRETIEQLRLITVEDPTSRWAEKAQAQLAVLTPQLPPTLADAAVLTLEERMTQAMEYFEAQRNPQAEAAFASLLSAPDLPPKPLCKAAYHRAQSRFKARDRQGAKLLFDEAARACHAAQDADLEIKSLYQAGRSYAFVGEHDIAIARYQTAQTIDNAHSYADDAMLREAEEWAAKNDDAKVRETLGALPAKFPQGDMRAEAMWRLGFRAWRNKRYDEAIGFWKKQIEVMPIDDNYYAEGQAQYWLGRAYLAKGDKAAALAQWREGILLYPAAYYALLSLNRTRETDAKAFAALQSEITTDPADFNANAPAFTFAPRAEWAAPGFARAMEYMRLGFGSAAAAELRKLGLAAPSNKQRVNDPDAQEKLWAMAYLFDKAGAYGTSHWPTRWHILDYRRQWPIGANRARWQIAYPKAYWPLLTTHATTNQLPVAMQIAIVREESAFDPLLESYANAIGLTQMIFPTAKRFAQGTGIEVSRETLRDPEKNVTIGSRFLGFLFKHWNNFVVLVPPSYNAGEGGVRKMLKARGTWATDEFIEGIIDDQARNYSKRVLGTYFTYSWLYEQTIPTIPLAIPTSLLPK